MPDWTRRNSRRSRTARSAGRPGRAGTGKTRTLTARVASLIDRDVPPERILRLTFARRAADELSLYAPLRMPHHRFGRDDRHSFAQVSRFLDDAAMSTMDVEDQVPVRQPAAVRGQRPRVALPTLDDLWA